MVVYFPGESRRGFCERTALSIAVAPMPAMSILLKSQCVVPAQPEPVPSGVRAVTVCRTWLSWS